MYNNGKSEKMDTNIILKYLQGKASEEEKVLFLSWMEESHQNRDEFVEFKKIWALTAKQKNTEGLTWSELKQNSIIETKKRTLLNRFVKQAAIFIFLIGLGGTAQYFISQNLFKDNLVYTKQYSVKTPLGQMTNMELPDGSSVMLNSGTTISYSGDFSNGHREVYIEGEAFFDIAKDKEHPFIVNSDCLGVKVYGTTFNVQAYPEDGKFAVTLIEGSVGILNNTGEEVSKLVPGEKAYFSKNETTIDIRLVDTEMYTSWKEGLVTFRNEKLEDIAKQIERWYNVEIVIQKEDLSEEHYFGTILKNKPIDQILEVLKLTTSLQYEIVPRANKPTLIYWK